MVNGVFNKGGTLFGLWVLDRVGCVGEEGALRDVASLVEVACEVPVESSLG